MTDETTAAPAPAEDDPTAPLFPPDPEPEPLDEETTALIATADASVNRLKVLAQQPFGKPLPWVGTLSRLQSAVDVREQRLTDVRDVAAELASTLLSLTGRDGDEDVPEAVSTAAARVQEAIDVSVSVLSHFAEPLDAAKQALADYSSPAPTED